MGVQGQRPCRWREPPVLPSGTAVPVGGGPCPPPAARPACWPGGGPRGAADPSVGPPWRL